MRSKEAIAILRGFCKREARGADGDPFAKGILAALRWMTEEDSPVPYAELVEDMPEDGGWVESGTQAGAMVLAPAPVQPARIITPEEYRQETMPKTAQYVPPTGTGLALDSTTSLAPDALDLVEAPSNPNLMIADRISTKIAENPWLREMLSVGADGQGRVPIHDGNAVAVGMGLEDEPYFQGGGRD